MEEHKRQFRGFWIPVGILNDAHLSATEKLLLAEIDALCGEDNEGCFASNAYLGKLVGVSASTAKNLIVNLRRLGYVVTVKSDGRKRWLRAHLTPPIGLSDSPKSGHQTPRNRAGRQPEIRPIDTKVDRNIEKYPLPLELQRLEADWLEWLEHRRQLRKPMTPMTYAKQIAKLKRMGVEQGAMAIQTAIEKGWTGFFEPTPKSTSKRKPEDIRHRSRFDEEFDAFEADRLRRKQR